jgi:tetratricopeptide (TPR) repeat protein
MIVREYYKKEIQEKSSISDDELRNYYEENKDKYKEKARVKVRHILCNSENEAKRILAELDRGADFKKLAKEKSKDKLSSKREGLLGNVTEGGYIPTIGRDEQIERILFSTPVHHYTGVVESKKGYHIFYIEEKKEPRQKDFEEVKEIIEGELKRTRMRDEFDAVIDSLKQAYHVEIFENNLAADTTDTGNASSGENNIFGENKKPVELKFKTNEKNDDADKAKQGKLDVDEMFELAGTLMDQPVKALEIYNRIIREFPQDPSVYKAEFMVGFINAENLGDTAAASVAFRELIKKYPESDLADDAAYMLKEIKKGKLAAGEDTKKNLLT